MLGTYSVAGGEGAASGPAATLREVERPIARTVAMAIMIPANPIGRRRISAVSALLMCAPAASQARRVTSNEFDAWGFVLESYSSMTCSVFAKSVKSAHGMTSSLRLDVILVLAGQHPAYGQVSSRRLMTTGVSVLRTTTHRNGSCSAGMN